MDKDKRAKLEATGWRVGSSEEFLHSAAGPDEHASATDAAIGQNARPPDRSKRRRRGVARAPHQAQINSDPWLSAYTDAIVKRGRDIAVQTVAKRFASSGVRLSRRERFAFAEFFAGTGPNPTIQRKRRRVGSPSRIALTPEDLSKFNQQLKRLVKAGAKAVPDVAEDVAADTLKRLKHRWPRQELKQRRSLRAFQVRLLKRWGKPLSQLDLLTTVAREFGERVGAAAQPGTKTPWLFEVLTRLHARACQIALEVHTLLSSGLADGAMARSRTLHEISATAFFVQENGENTAERYVLHEAIESWRAACEYNRHASALKMQRFSKREMDRLAALRSKLLDRFGKSFDGHYGWAANIKKPESTDPVRSFSDIEESVMPHLRPYYQLASHKVHAKAKGVYSQLGAMGDRQILLAGASNAGLADPGQNAALFLCQATTVLGLLHASFETTMMMKLMRKLEREVGASFVGAHRRLVKDERRRQEAPN